MLASLTNQLHDLLVPTSCYAPSHGTVLLATLVKVQISKIRQRRAFGPVNIYLHTKFHPNIPIFRTNSYIETVLRRRALSAPFQPPSKREPPRFARRLKMMMPISLPALMIEYSSRMMLPHVTFFHLSPNVERVWELKTGTPEVNTGKI